MPSANVWSKLPAHERGLILRARGLLSALLLGIGLWGVATAPDAGAAGDASATGVGVEASPWPPPPTRVSWTSPSASRRSSWVHLKLLGFNDFHGNLESPGVSSARPAGGAAVLAAYLEAQERAAPGRTLIVHAGDQLGASPPMTRLLQNEPAVQFLNLLANHHCEYGLATHFYDAHSGRLHPDRCNVIGTLGNHEFDAGVPELLRLLNGGNAGAGPFLENPYRGSRVPYVCANVRDRRTGALLLPPYAVVKLGGISIGVIGAVLRDTPSMVPAWAVANLEFLDEAESINRAAAQLEGAGIHTLIVLIHQGAVPVSTGVAERLDWQGPLRDIVAQLDPDIDVVVSGHTHQYTNALLPNRAGTPVLVTQAYAYGVAFSDIDLQVDPLTRDVVQKSALIVPTWIDQAAGLTPDAAVQRLTAAAGQRVAARVARVVGHLPQPVTRALSPAGESALGDLVADAQRLATHADIALMNPGGLRADLRAGPVTWGDILTLHPFANHLVTLRLTGAQLLAVLEQQWPSVPNALPRILKTSGLYYRWDPARPAGSHVIEACDAARAPLDPSRNYRVTVNDFLAAGGDGFLALKEAGAQEIGPLDSEALEQYLLRDESIAPGTQVRIGRADLQTAALCALAPRSGG